MDEDKKSDTPEIQQADNDEPVIRANVTENNGEISCSVEETNRIRIALGLKPLDTSRKGKEAEAVENFKRNAEALEQ